jgi:hypothetical protein
MKIYTLSLVLAAAETAAIGNAVADDNFELAMRFSDESSFSFYNAIWTNEELMDEGDQDAEKNLDGKFSPFVDTIASAIRGCFGTGEEMSCKTYELQDPMTLLQLFTTTPLSVTDNYQFHVNDQEDFWWYDNVNTSINIDDYRNFHASGINFHTSSVDSFSAAEASVRFGAMFNNEFDFITSDVVVGFGLYENRGGSETTDTVGSGIVSRAGGNDRTQGSIWVLPENTSAPTKNPTASPTENPTASPTKNPTASPTKNPTPRPTQFENQCSALDAGSNQNLGTLNMCLRSSLGYSYDDADNGVTYQEVNFIESLIRIEYDLTSGFCVDGFAVAPKEKELTSFTETYEDSLVAYLCIGPQHPEYNGGENNHVITISEDVSYSIPKPVNEYNAALGEDAVRFNQGSLINVCIQVKDEIAAQGIVLKSIVEFSWTRTGGTTYDSSIGGGTGDATITQNAITQGVAATNYLTSYQPSSCLNEYWCDFASVLFAQFYNTDGTVSGSGDAELQFKTTERRLGENKDLREEENRRLQEDPGASSMDISINVNGMADGPGELKTAGGASPGTVVFASAVAFVGAVLLA